MLLFGTIPTVSSNPILVVTSSASTPKKWALMYRTEAIGIKNANKFMAQYAAFIIPRPRPILPNDIFVAANAQCHKYANRDTLYTIGTSIRSGSGNCRTNNDKN
jgi:hypothetical protein